MSNIDWKNVKSVKIRKAPLEPGLHLVGKFVRHNFTNLVQMWGVMEIVQIVAPYKDLDGEPTVLVRMSPQLAPLVVWLNQLESL